MTSHIYGSPTRDEGALGAVLGALVGDAAGAVLEFFGRPIQPEDVARAMTMPGGGTWGVAPGQVTDDGELTMSMLHALASAPEQPVERAATLYAEWAASDPFDIGATTRASLGCLRDRDLATMAGREGAAVVMTRTASERCMGSKANGSLMRATPLGVWGATRERALVVDTTARDVRLSHPNEACVGSTVAYVLAIRHLLRAPGDVTGALAEARDVLTSARNEEVLGWLADAERGVLVPYTPMDGFVRIGFTHAFRHLVLGSAYDVAVRETLAGGGDTDTNACIVGGLIGARWGASSIPATMRRAVIECDTSRGSSPRPERLHPRLVPDLLGRVLTSS
jgi:ADP-ribosyl-[dinitrogen reductase] hydrolase